MDQNELYHHGIKGQKWGVRRYQNPDGTLTNAGRKRKGLSDKQKKTLKTALKVGAIAAGTALAAYGAYKLNQKATKALIESYSDVGDVLSSFASNNYDISYKKLVSAEQELHRGRKASAEILSYSSNYHNKLGSADRRISDELKSKANAGHFTVKERASAMGNIATRGSKSFGKIKREELLKKAQNRARTIAG